MKLQAPATLKSYIRLAIPGCVAFSLTASLMISISVSCMACPTCTLALARHTDKPDNSALALLALLGMGNKRIWLTGTAYTGALGGISGADAKCNNAGDANWPGSGNYKAMIVDGTARRACTTANCFGGASEHLDWVLQPNKTYVRADGATVIFTADANGVWDFGVAGNWTNSISSASREAWTGINSNWMSGGMYCSLWSDGSHTLDGILGWTMSTLGTVDNNGSSPLYEWQDYCDKANVLLYCVEQ